MQTSGAKEWTATIRSSGESARIEPGGASEVVGGWRRGFGKEKGWDGVVEGELRLRFAVRVARDTLRGATLLKPPRRNLQSANFSSVSPPTTLRRKLC